MKMKCNRFHMITSRDGHEKTTNAGNIKNCIKSNFSLHFIEK